MIYAIIAAIIILIYLYLIMPSIGRKEIKDKFVGVNFAHRGLHDIKNGIPENSLAAFKNAVDHGYGVEFDVQLTSDNVAVVFHDDSLERMCGVDMKIYEMTYEEISDMKLLGTDNYIPLLTDVIKVIDGQVPILMEIKMHNLDTKVCTIANDIMKDYQGLYCMESFQPLAVRWYRKNRPDIMRGQLSTHFGVEDLRRARFENPAQWLVHHLLTNHFCRPDFIAYSYKRPNTVSRNIVRHLYKTPQFAWTIRSQGAMEEVNKKFDNFIFEQFIPKV